MKSLKLQCDPEHLNDVSDENDPIEIATEKFKNHPSIVNINENIPKTKLLVLIQEKVEYLEESQPIA